MDERTIWEDLGKCNVTKPRPVIIDVGDVKDVDIVCPRPTKTDSYTRLHNKPQINGVTLEGNKTTEELNIETDANFIYEQTEASAEWIIVHNLNKYPAVSIIDSAGDEVVGNVHYDSVNQVTITFTGAFKGTATLN